MSTEIERGIPYDGINPALIEDFGGDGSLTAAASSFRTMSEQIRLRLLRMDGDDRGVWIIYRRPPEIDFDRVQPSELVEYIQSAGSAEAMTVEVRRREDDGRLHHYAVGRDGGEAGERVISWASGDPAEPHRVTVPVEEVFTAEQAHPVYLQWCWDQTVPVEGFHLRELDLSDA